MHVENSPVPRPSQYPVFDHLATVHKEKTTTFFTYEYWEGLGMQKKISLCSCTHVSNIQTSMKFITWLDPSHNRLQPYTEHSAFEYSWL